MSDLISRKALIGAIHNFVEAHRNDDDISWTGLDWLLKEDDVVAMVNNIPAAYDVDKVVEWLKGLEQFRLDLADSMSEIQKHGHERRHYVCLEDVVKILKGGGVDE